MYPRLFEYGVLSVYTYGALLAAAYLLGLQLAMRRARVRGLDETRVMDLGIYIIISALIGAKLLLFLTEYQSYLSWQGLLNLARSGGVFYGGLILAVSVALIYIRRIGLPLWTTCDVFAPGIALGHVIGRLGCFFAGCCYGKAAPGLPWAITFTSPLASENANTPLNVPLHPTQLYEAGAEALILALLLSTESRGRRYPGRTFWLYMLLYAVSRFIIEFYRGDTERGIYPVAGFTLSTSQLISIVLVPLATIMLVYLRRGTEPTPKHARKAA